MITFITEVKNILIKDENILVVTGFTLEKLDNIKYSIICLIFVVGICHTCDKF